MSRYITVNVSSTVFGSSCNDHTDQSQLQFISIFLLNIILQNTQFSRCRRRLKCDGTRAETRFRLSAKRTSPFNPLNPELNPICYLLALLGAHHFLHVSKIRVKLLTLRQLMSYIYGAPILDVSRSHTTTQHSR